ncbi:hypothetical protein KVT40_003493 [Elsinoe batatas]|uniref:catalase n=1 Tax=Elsinoe batatas TaxID=2601811 RepID=A0A8K0L7N8_9PEZI|nr:hypothetical protein KVT40_003493 [Elsinoe batatas]
MCNDGKYKALLARNLQQANRRILFHSPHITLESKMVDSMVSMKNTVASGLEKAKDGLDGSSKEPPLDPSEGKSYGSFKNTITGAAQDAKAKDLARNTVDLQNSKGRLTTDYGVKVPDTDNWLKVSILCYLKTHGREKIHRFDHERIPERVVHARGAGAFGKFTLKESLSDVTNAKVLTDKSKPTPTFLRFSTVLGSRGSADTVRDVRGFAIKFYTDEGNWDMVGNNIPVFFIQDAIKFPDVVHAAKPEPHNEIPQAQSAHNNFWDFQYLHEEATHMFMWTNSDRAIPRSYRMQQGFGVNTYTLINDKGERHFVKFHFIPHLGVHSLVWDEALKLNGQDPDFHRKDLWMAIEAGHFPKWDMHVQLIPEADEHKFEFDMEPGKGVKPDHHFEGQRSTMYDAIFIPGGADSVATLRKNGRALHYVREAFGHLKAIGATGEAVKLVQDAAALPGIQFSQSGDVVNSYGVVTAAKVEESGLKEPAQIVKSGKSFVEQFFFAISQHKNFDREMDGLNEMVAY